MSFVPVNQPAQNLVTEVDITADVAINLTEDVSVELCKEIDEKLKAVCYIHDIKLGSCVCCLKMIGNIPLCIYEMVFKNCKKCHNNRSHCDSVNLLKKY